MRRILSGRILDHEAWVGGHVHRGRLVLSPPSDLRLIIDTGFSGFLALPPAVIREMDLDLVGSEWHALADGSEMDPPIYAGTIQVGRAVQSGEIIPLGAEGLVGMAFLERLGDELQFLFRRRRVGLFADWPRRRSR